MIVDEIQHYMEATSRLRNGCEQALLLLERQRFAEDSEAKVVRAVLRGALNQCDGSADCKARDHIIGCFSHPGEGSHAE